MLPRSAVYTAHWRQKLPWPGTTQPNRLCHLLLIIITVSTSHLAVETMKLKLYVEILSEVILT